jgi:signal transduction histidine kinase
MSGLRAALESLVRQFDHTDLRCTLHIDTCHDTHDPELETHLYRIAQEALCNAVRHSKARNIDLKYRCNTRSIHLEVLDDGTGLRGIAQPDGMGLRNMRYRIHILNGSLDVVERKSGGTRVVCACPCRAGTVPAGTVAARRYE